MGCGGQNLNGLGLNDHVDVIAYLDWCQDAGTGEIYGPDSYYLAGPDGLVNFGFRGTAVIAALNAWGHVAGGIGVPHGWHAFLWDGRRIVDLGTLGGQKSQAVALNDHSQVAGWSTTRSGKRHGFLWAGGRMTDIGAVVPLAVNAQGAVLSTRTEGKRLHAFLWHDGRTADVGYWRTPSAGNAHILGAGRRALALDDAGRVAGTDGQGHAAVWEQGHTTRLPEPPGATASAAVDIDVRGGIAGWIRNERGQLRAVLWGKRS